MKFLLCGGGTGGHVTPALSVAQKLKELSRDNEIHFIGRLGGRENSAVIKAGIPLSELEIYGIKRSLSFSNVKRVICAISAVKKAKKLIKSFSPDVILGTGGYVCWPVLVAGRRLGIPTAIHESNVYPGLVTRLLAKKCKAVLINKDQTRRYLGRGGRTITVGNPISSEIYRTKRADARRIIGLKSDDVFILSFGGSGGADVFNTAIYGLMREFSAQTRGVTHLHATGRAYYDKWISEKEMPNGCKVTPYIENMPRYLSAADIVITRCGAMTLSELSAAGCCSVLIPSPNVTADHQRKNARELQDSGAAIMIDEMELSDGKLISCVTRLYKTPELRRALSLKIAQHRTPKAADDIAKILCELGEDKKGKKQR